MQKLSCKEIADIINGEPVGNTGLSVNTLNRSEMASENELTFLADEKYLPYLIDKSNICIITSNEFASRLSDKNGIIIVGDPYKSFVELLNYLNKQKPAPKPGIHPSAVIEDDYHIHPDATIYPNVYIGHNCTIKEGAVIRANAVLYDNVTIGENTIINSNVVIYDDCIIGSNCILHSGAVIGADGFGYTEERRTGTFTKIPQLGNVIIEDDVEIGANSTVDCAIAGSTIIRKGVKIDNLVQVAHNCVVGENTGIASQTGISGSDRIGARNRLGGQVGLAGHIDTADDVIILAQSGVAKSIPERGIYFGSPVKPHRRAFKIESVLRNLPEIADEINNLRKELNELKSKG